MSNAILRHVAEIFLGSTIDIQGVLKTFGIPFVIAFALARAGFFALAKRITPPAGFSPTAVSIMSAAIVVVALYSIYFAAAMDSYPKIAVTWRLAFLILLFAPILLGLTPLLIMYVIGIANQKRLASPTLLVAATGACLILQALWFDTWTTAR